MGAEATAARGFHKGELTRFVLFTSYSDQRTIESRPIPTEAFTIDEEAGEDAMGLRIRH